MKPLIKLDSIACPLPFANVDTDQLIPARFMSRTRGEGYGDLLLHDFRREGGATLRTDLAINDPRFEGAEVLIARANFGSGSSREAAVYALSDAGFRVVVAPSFGDIFTGNAVNNGMLPARVGAALIEDILGLLATGPQSIVVDLDAQELRIANHVIPFAVEPVHRTKLLNGWDDLDLTASYAEDIAAFADRLPTIRPWGIPSRGRP